MSHKDNIKEMREKSKESRMESAEEFADKLVEKLGDKVKCVAVWGSVPKGEHGYDSDIDTLVILDDTKLQNDVPQDARDKIKRKVTDLAKETDERITIQYFPFLTEFWDSLRNGEPIAIEAVRNGEAVYDVGIFMPAKRLLQRGKISGTQESVKKRLNLGASGYKKAENTVRSSIPHKLEQAMANAGQAPIMLAGKQPPGKEKVPGVLEEMFVENEMLEQEYVDIARDIVDFADLGEKESENVTGDMVEEHLQKTDDFVRRMHELVSQIGAKKKVKGLYDEYKNFLKANVAALRAQEVEPPEDREDLPKVVEENLDLGEEHQELFERWDDIISKVKEKSLNEVNDKELYDLQSESREFVSSVGRDIQKAKQDAEKMSPKMNPEKIAEAADTEGMTPDVDKEKEEEKAE